MPCCREIAKELQVNLLGYDYSGYGASSGQPTVLNTLADIDACYKWLLDHGKKPGDIVIYGQSVGSGPSCYLGAKKSGVAGVILHSPLATGNIPSASLLQSLIYNANPILCQTPVMCPHFDGSWIARHVCWLRHHHQAFHHSV